MLLLYLFLHDWHGIREQYILQVFMLLTAFLSLFEPLRFHVCYQVLIAQIRHTACNGPDIRGLRPHETRVVMDSSICRVLKS